MLAHAHPLAFVRGIRPLLGGPVTACNRLWACVTTRQRDASLEPPPQGALSPQGLLAFVETAYIVLRADPLLLDRPDVPCRAIMGRVCTLLAPRTMEQIHAW